MDVYSWFRRSLSSSRKNSTPSSSSTAAAENGGLKVEEVQLYGITDQLIEFVKSFSLDTFRNFSLPDEEGCTNGDEGKTAANVRKDLSEWQERHAMLILSKVKELSQLRFRLCPCYLKEGEFWRIYFILVRSYISKYELHAIRLAKLKEMRQENETHDVINTYEVEMSESKQAKPVVVHTDSFERD